jgi:O-antigen/teichoic acid export membrane protein
MSSADRSGSRPFSGARSIARNTTTLAAAQVVGIVTRLAYIVLVARLLGPELYALLAYSQAWYLAFLPLALFGRGIVVHTIAREPHRTADIAAQAMGIRLYAAVIASIACAGLAWILPGSRDVASLITVLLLALTGRALTTAAQDLFRAHEVTHHTLRQEAMFRVIECIAGAAILLMGGGLLMLVAANGIIWWLQAAYAFHVVNRDLVPLRVAWRPREWLPAARMAQPFFLLSLAAAWCQDGPLILYRHLADNDSLYGQFALAMQAFLIPAGLAQALAAAAQPVITRSAQRGDDKDLAFGGLMLRVAVLVGGLAGFLGLGVGPWLFHMLFGARFATAGELVGPALFCLVPMLAGIGLPPVIMARGHFRAGTAAMVASALTMTLMMPLLVPRLGAYGAMLALALGYAAGPLIAAVYAARRRWPADNGATMRAVSVLIVAALAWLSLAGISRGLAMTVAVAALAGGTILLGVFTPGERAILSAIWRERRSTQVD